MIVKAHQKGSLFYAQIDDMYTEQEIQSIEKELLFLETLKQSPEMTNSASKNGVSLKTGHGIFLDDVYTNRNFSSILKINRKLFDPKITEGLAKQNCFYEHLAVSDYDSTLINFYGPTDNYNAHRDTSIFTAVTFFKIGNFSGGELSFVDYGVTIEPVVGRTVIFSGCTKHQAEPVVAKEGNYRVTMAQFIEYKKK